MKNECGKIREKLLTINEHMNIITYVQMMQGGCVWNKTLNF